MLCQAPQHRRNHMKTYLVFIKLGGGNDLTRERIAEAARSSMRTINEITGGDYKMAFASSDGASYAFFVRHGKEARFIRSALYGAGRHQTALLNDDSCLVLEIGPDFDGMGFSDAWTWLQHHHRP